MKVTATEAKNRLGQVLEQAQRSPVFIDKGGRRHSVVMSIDHYEQLLRSAQSKRQGSAGKRFYAQYKEWVDEQHRHFEKYGVFGEEFRAW